MRKTLKLNLPSINEITAGLEQLTCYPALTRAEEQLAAASVALDDARQKIEEATTAADTLPAEVHAGKASQADLEQAISAVKATEVMLPFHERDLATAQEALTEAKGAARGAVIEEGRRRRDELQGIADEISPVLAELRELEISLLEALRTQAPEPHGDPVALVQALKLSPPLEPVRWEVSLAGRNRLVAGVHPGAVVETQQ